MINQLTIPMSSPDIASGDIAAVNAVLQTPVLSIGPRVDEFERCTAPLCLISSNSSVKVSLVCPFRCTIRARTSKVGGV